MTKRILVRGPVLTQSGYGEHARMILRALREREDLFDIFIIPLNWGQTGWISEKNEFRDWLDERIKITSFLLQQKPVFDISIQVTIPNEFERIASVNIGVTAGVETTKISPQWIQKCNEMDKIIVPSTFAKWGFENTSYDSSKIEVPIEVVPYPVRDDLEILPEFPALGLTENDFAYILVGQWGPRKNMDNAIRWWLEENWEQDVSLIVKTSHRRNNLMDRQFTENRLKGLLDSLRLDKVKRKCSLKLLHGDMSEVEMKALYYHPAIKCMVTATHGEGFGLPLFEFAQTGKIIVAPGWSAHLDFLTYINDKGESTNGFLEVDYTMGPVQKEVVWEGVIQADSSWCFPEENSFKQRIRQARTKYKKWEPKAKLVAENIKKEFSWFSVNNKFIETLVGKPKPVNGVAFCVITDAKRPEKTRITLNSIKKTIENSSIPAEIILCGNVSEFEEIEGIKTIYSDGYKEGFLGKMRNLAAESSEYENLVFADDDIIFDPEWINNFVNFSNSKPWNILGNRIYLPDGSRYWDRCILSPHILVSYEHPENDKKLYQCGCFWVIRKEVWQNNKWDESIPFYNERNGGINEDVEYSTRLQSKGYNLSFDPENLVWHNDDTYAEWSVMTPHGQFSVTLKKSIIKERYNVEVNNPTRKKFKQLLESL